MAIDTSIETFRALYPEFAAVPDPTVEMWLEAATDELAQAAWGTCYGRAVQSYAAHNVSLGVTRASGGGGGVGMPSGLITSASAEGLSVSFATPASGSNDYLWWGQTPYGQAYLAAARSCLDRGGLSW